MKIKSLKNSEKANINEGNRKTQAFETIMESPESPESSVDQGDVKENTTSAHQGQKTKLPRLENAQTPQDSSTSTLDLSLNEPLNITISMGPSNMDQNLPQTPTNSSSEEPPQSPEEPSHGSSTNSTSSSWGYDQIFGKREFDRFYSPPGSSGQSSPFASGTIIPGIACPICEIPQHSHQEFTTHVGHCMNGEDSLSRL